MRLLLVDLAGELDELGREVVLARLEGEVERVDRQAVAAHPRAGLEAHEAVGLGRRRVDHLPDVDPHPVAEHRELVDERDVDRAEDVLEQLRHLRRLGRGDRRRPRRRSPSRARPRGRGRPRSARRRPSASCAREWSVRPGSIRSGEKARWKSRPGGQARLLEDRLQALAGRAGVGGRLEHDELALAQDRGQRAPGVGDVAEVGLALVGERRRHADQDRVAVGELAGSVVTRMSGRRPRQALVGDVLDLGCVRRSATRPCGCRRRRRRPRGPPRRRRPRAAGRRSRGR